MASEVAIKSALIQHVRMFGRPMEGRELAVRHSMKTVKQLLKKGEICAYNERDDEVVRRMLNRYFSVVEHIQAVLASGDFILSAEVSKAKKKATSAPASNNRVDVLEAKCEELRKAVARAEEKTVSANRTANYYRNILVETYKHDLGDVVDLCDDD